MKEPFSIANERQGDWAETVQSLYFRIKSHLKRYWWVLIFTTVAAVAYQLYVDSNREPVYVSYAKMKVEGRFNLAAGNTYQEAYGNFFGTQLDLMKSERIKERARERVAAMYPDLVLVPVSINAYLQPNTVIFILSASSSNAKVSEFMLNAVMEEYLNDRREERNRTAKSTMLTITEQVSAMERDLAEIEEQMVEFQRKNNVIGLRELGSSAGSYLNNLKNQMADLRMKQRRLDSLKLDSKMVSGDSDLSLVDVLEPAVLEASQGYQRSKQAYDEAVAKRDEFGRFLKPKHPKMMRLNREIQDMAYRLEIVAQQTLEQIHNQRRSVAQQIENLTPAIKEAEKEALAFSQRLAEFERLESQRNRMRQLYEKLLDNIQNIDVSTTIQSEMVSIYESASPASTHTMNRMDSVLKGATVGLGIGAFFIFLIGNLDKRVISTEDLKRHFSEPVLGIIPKETGVDTSSIDFMEEKGKRHIFAEAFRTLRSSILFMEQMEPRPNTFIITSAVPEEGKSTIASNLAISLAIASSRTLLVDADLRRGRLNRLFKLPNRNGLVEVLQGVLSLEDSIHHTEVENLDFIPRGQTVPNSGELLLSEQMQQVIETVKHNYDFVIFDAAPVLATDDTTSFASKVDAILYVVRSTTIRLRQVKVSLENLKMRSANIAGFIMNFADTRGMDYYYYNKYQYYYRYQSQEVAAPTGKKKKR